VYITLTKCAEHIPVEVPNNRVQVTYLLDLFKTIYPSILAPMAAVCQDNPDKRVNFKNAYTFMAPYCPVASKLAKKERVLFDANISGTGVNLIKVDLEETMRNLERGKQALPSVIKSLMNTRICLMIRNRN
jgi:hypothetical protein